MKSATRPRQPGARTANPGLFLEDFKPGDVYEHRLGRTVTEADNIQFSLLTVNTSPLHCDSFAARSTEFGKPLVNSLLTLSIVAGIVSDDVLFNTIANLGWNSIKLSAPVFPGDTLYARSTVKEVRPSKSRPGQGIVTLVTEAYKDDGTVVLSYEKSNLMPARARPS
ncbi:MAG: MaoC family dehydratase [Reyranellaceae bacterium]